MIDFENETSRENQVRRKDGNFTDSHDRFSDPLRCLRNSGLFFAVLVVILLVFVRRRLLLHVLHLLKQDWEILAVSARCFLYILLKLTTVDRLSGMF
jgi:hypothetical protein